MLSWYTRTLMWHWGVAAWNATNAQDGYTALVQAAARGHLDCARHLLDAGADKETKTNVCATVAIFLHVLSTFNLVVCESS